MPCTPPGACRGLSVLLKGTVVIKQDCDLDISLPHVGFWAAVLCVSSPEPRPQGYCCHIQNKQTDKIDQISAGRQHSFMEQNPAHFHRNKIRSSPTDALHEPNALEPLYPSKSVCVSVRASIQDIERHGRGSQSVTDLSQDLQLALICAISAEKCVFSASTEYKVWVSDKCDRFAKKGREKRRGKRSNFLIWWVMITDPGRDLNGHWSVMFRKSN